jgi:GntR family transcriptional regulator, transcriptional repressor for pyruvate dehydrogenase complex
MDAPNARRITQTIADEIVAGRLRPGEQLPSERALATRHGVGRPLIREALRSLGELGLIETHAGRGTYVRATSATGVHRQVGLAIRRRGVTAAELSEARITLESEAAGLAAERATDTDIERLERALRDLEGAQGLMHVQRDLAFHLAIAAAAHNPVIEMMLESIAPLTVALMTRSVGDPEVMSRSQPYHGIALEAIRHRDAAAARAAIVAHLSVARDLYGDDYERSVDTLAQRAMEQRGALASLDEVVTQVLAARDIAQVDGPDA